MMKSIIAIILFCAVLFGPFVSFSAKSGGVITDLSSDEVPIEWNFTGAEILLFGAIEGEAEDGERPDVIVVVRGPKKTVIARKKQRVAGIWVNTNPKELRSVPLYYSVASSRPLRDIAPSSILDKLDIGFDALIGNLVKGSKFDDASIGERYSEAAVRIMETNGLYSTGGHSVKIVGDRLFQVKIALPANVPSGKFTADVYLFRGGKLLGRRVTNLSIQKTGFERFVYNSAYQYPSLYGVVAVILAVGAGLAATALFKNISKGTI